MRSVAASVAITVVFAARATAQVPVLLVSLTEPQVRRDGNDVSLVVTVANHAAKPIVALQVNFEFRGRDGARRGATVRRDGYLRSTGNRWPASVLDTARRGGDGRHAKLRTFR